jgi:hypothetical protein
MAFETAEGVTKHAAGADATPKRQPLRERLPSDVRELRSLGVKFESDQMLELPWGYVARVKDRDGNLLQVREGRGQFKL